MLYRWLNNEQALADSANFLANVKFAGIDEDLTAPNTPWIYYGVCRICGFAFLGPFLNLFTYRVRMLVPDRLI